MTSCEGIDQGSILPSLYDRAREHLKMWDSKSSAEKRALRKQLVDDQPELRIRLDTQRLKQIIDYAFFKCSPYSSVARDEAIQGSDIDGGIVVSNERPSLEQELMFIQELRVQGFDVYHPTEEIVVLAILFPQGRYESSGQLPPSLEKFREQPLGVTFQVIRFHSRQEIDDLVSKELAGLPKAVEEGVALNTSVAVYLAGVSLALLYPHVM